jgi:2-methylisocitrate lyase-like PEP mutase family enzyme
MSRFNIITAKFTQVFGSGVHEGKSRFNTGAKPLIPSARGFKAALISGAGLAESRLGVPDVGILGLADNLEGTRMIASRTNLLLIADADTGYGNAMTVYHVVKEFEKTGVAGIMIEDQVWPKRCGHLSGKEVIPTEEMVAKIRAAVDARENLDFIIKARTDAAIKGIEEAINRANAYLKAGADLVLADALLSVQDIEKFTKNVGGPVAVNMGFGIRRRPTTPLLTPKVLKEIGVKVIDYGRITSAAAIMGMKKALTALLETVDKETVTERPDLVVDFNELQELMDYKKYLELDRKYRVE